MSRPRNSKGCSELGCEKPYYAKGLCKNHYYKNRTARGADMDTDQGRPSRPPQMGEEKWWDEDNPPSTEQMQKTYVSQLWAMMNKPDLADTARAWVMTQVGRWLRDADATPQERMAEVAKLHEVVMGKAVGS